MTLLDRLGRESVFSKMEVANQDKRPHLWVGTDSDNFKDAIQKGRVKPPHLYRALADHLQGEGE